MWSVGCISGLIFVVNISAGMHLGGMKEPLRHQDRVQLQAQEKEPEFTHHHIQEIEKIYHTYLGEPTSVVRKRAVSQQMRMHVYYDPDTVPQLSTALRDVIKNVLIKEAVEYFKNTLKVRSVKTPIRLFRPCNFQSITYVGTDKTGYCTRGCAKVPLCGSVKIPEEHLKGCHKLSMGRATIEGDDGPGVDTDFILYVSANATSSCGPQTIGYAVHCQQELALDRPVAGHVNICPASEALGDAPNLRQGAIATVKHEIIHALAFSDSLYSFFRDTDGNPLTARESFGLPPITGGIRKWSSKITQRFDRPGWKTVHMMVTPAVVREARRHFGCDSLEGAELEDQGGEGTAGSHWEKRVFENEALTGSLTQNPVISRVTLALLEDTGWYHVNYRMAEALLYGFGKGCDFAKKSCKDYMEMKRNAGQSVSPYCDVPGEERQDKFSCLAESTAVAYCNLAKYPSVLDTKFQHFTHIDGVNDKDVPFYGGRTVIADYCPFWRKFVQTTAANKTGDSQCRFPENQIGERMNFLRQTFSEKSVCFKHKEKWVIKISPTLPGSAYGTAGGGCYKIKCGTAEVNGYKVYVDANEFECKTERQEVAVESKGSRYTHTGILICPPYKLVCQKLTAPHFPGDDEAWNRSPIPTGLGPGATPPGKGRPGTTPASDATTSGGIKISGRSGVSALGLCWALVIYAVLVQMTLCNYVSIVSCVGNEIPASTEIMS